MLVSFEDYNGNKVEVNPAFVKTVQSFAHYDHDMPAPDEWLEEHTNGLQVKAEHVEKLDELRTSNRTIIAVNDVTYIVKGTVAEVKKALGVEEPKRAEAKK